MSRRSGPEEVASSADALLFGSINTPELLDRVTAPVLEGRPDAARPLRPQEVAALLQSLRRCAAAQPCPGRVSRMAAP
jgi:hypothetical protein